MKIILNLLLLVVSKSDALIQQQNSVFTSSDIDKISKGGVAVIHDFLSPSLITRLREDAQNLFEQGNFQPDGLTNTAKSKTEQGFTGKADRQTFRGGADWESKDVGDWKARKEFSDQMTLLRNELAVTLTLPRPTLQKEGIRRHEMTYNWYEPGAKLGRHLDEHHEETKGSKGWLLPTRRSVTWLVYLNHNWEEHEGGALRTFPREHIPTTSSSMVLGAHEGNLQVGWLHDVEPVYLDCFRESGQSALYRIINDGNDNSIRRDVLTKYDFDVPRQPIEFVKFLPEQYQNKFEQISTARLDPRFASPDNTEEECEAARSLLADKNETYHLDVLPKAGTLVLFDSVTLPHLVQEVTSKRQRIAATGWFHEDSQFFLEQQEPM
mmetsp:Transcript_2535/g.3728  ORF Transcript_2535/g.3728 Transcript_2535/m.3728 type:complete len:380 (+) Transcript_2535:92-1231(+)|eukprot:CAMPEP_0194248142 /NCGR_PEP_ID=MMETSP0158-20130606/17679_1 /TAXON_ID=33649 /ORGANISM="Thalassionema nitzschioides, Strain L26-B" /LENGTH=379 /DNA_ID=CAMNT_0038984353 /DNA_START=13 /DNA_END=1152 /DNA_ORIENTATION=-